MRSSSRVSFGILPLFLAPASAQIDQDVLDRTRAQVVPVVEKATGVELKGITIRFATRKEIAESLAEEAKELKNASAMNDAQRRRYARGISRILLAKFSWNTNEIMICRENFRWQAKALKKPELNAEGALRAVLVHECVHAVDEKRFGWSKVANSLTSVNKLLAYNAVIEGHAQHVAGKICEDNGWSEGFATYTSIIGTTSPDEDPGERLINELAAANIAATYKDGRRFVAYMDEKLATKGIEKAFADPPADFEVVLNPQWYLDPESRPKTLYELGKPLRNFRSTFSKDAWSSKELVLGTPQLRAALTLLPEKDIDRVLAGLKAHNLLVLSDKVNPNKRLVVAGLYEFASPSAARYYVLATIRLSKLKDDTMKKGTIQVVSADYEPIEEPRVFGTLAKKTITVMRNKVSVNTVVAMRGSVCVELMYSNEKVTDAKIKSQAMELLTLAAKKETK